MQRKEKIVYLRVEDLKLNPRNPRKNDKAVDAVAKSIERFGFRNPLMVDKDKMVWCGNTRLKSAQKLGLEEVPCIDISDLSEKEIRALALADNKTNEIADWDLELLQEELDALVDEFDMADFGFAEELEELLDEIEPQEDDFDVESAIEEITEPRVKLGEVWQLGEHRLMCGDSTNAEDVAKLMGGQLADLVVTDPPYNVDISNSKGMKIENDNMLDNQFYEFLSKSFENMNILLKNGGVFYVWCIDHKIDIFIKALKQNGLIHNETLIWNKNTFVLGHLDYHKKHEPCLYGWKDGERHYFTDDRTQSTIIEDKGIDLKKLKKEEMLKLLQDVFSDKYSTTIINEDKPSKCDLHPTMKPIKLLARLIKNSSRQNEVVLDLFGGSGSTLIACEQLNRKCYMMELDEKYATVIVDRWEQFTGKQAVKIQ